MSHLTGAGAAQAAQPEEPPLTAPLAGANITKPGSSAGPCEPVVGCSAPGAVARAVAAAVGAPPAGEPRSAFRRRAQSSRKVLEGGEGRYRQEHHEGAGGRAAVAGAGEVSAQVGLRLGEAGADADVGDAGDRARVAGTQVDRF